jgi:hypothetical protein
LGDKIAADGLVYIVTDRAMDNRKVRGKSMDKATVGNGVLEDPMSAEQLRRLWPGFVRVEVLDTSRGDEEADYPPIMSILDNYKLMKNAPASMEYKLEHGTIDPLVCCAVPPERDWMPNHKPQKDDLLLWETDITAMGVRHYPGNIGWAAAMTVEDRADVGSYWSGIGHNFDDPSMFCPRRINLLLGQQAGWMATRSQILYFHEHACPGGF